MLACTLALALVACKKETKVEAGKDPMTAPAADPKMAPPATPPAADPATPPPATPPAAGGATSDNSDPVKVVEQIFAAASSGKADALAGLCDPAGTGDGDVKDVCGSKPGSPKWDEFVKYFSKGKVAGAPKVEGDSAAVAILFGPNGTKKETMNLKKIDGKWYLAGF